MVAEMEYQIISHWTQEARARLVAEQGDEIRLLLDEAFFQFADSHGLAAFGFRQSDPIHEAVEWTVERFSHGNLKPEKIQDRSFRLFTKPSFWLAQKVGLQAYKCRMAELNGGLDYQIKQTLYFEHFAAQREGRSAEVVLKQVGQKLAGALRVLRRRTCADLVGFWLRGTESLRKRLFGWKDSGSISPDGEKRSRSQKTSHRYDALFRYFSIFHQLINKRSVTQEDRASLLGLFTPCENTPPYRNPDEAIAAELGLKGGRQAAQARKKGTTALLARCLERVEREPATEEEHLYHLFALGSFRTSTAGALKVTDTDLKERLKRLPTKEEYINVKTS